MILYNHFGIKPHILCSTFIKANEQSNPLKVCEGILIKPPSCLLMASKTDLFCKGRLLVLILI